MSEYSHKHINTRMLEYSHKHIHTRMSEYSHKHIHTCRHTPHTYSHTDLTSHTETHTHIYTRTHPLTGFDKKREGEVLKTSMTSSACHPLCPRLQFLSPPLMTCTRISKCSLLRQKRG